MSRRVASSAGRALSRKRADLAPRRAEHVLETLTVGARQHVGESVESEQLAVGRARLRQAVGEDRQTLAWAQRELVLGEGEAGADAERRALRRELARLVVAQHEHRVVPSAGDGDGAGLRVEGDDREGEEGRHALPLEVAGEPVVHLAQDLGRLLARGDGVVQQGARHGHDERRGETLAHHVAADDRPAAVAERHVVVVVAAHLAEELDALRQGEAVDLRGARGQQVELDALRALDLGGDLELGVAQLVVQALRGLELGAERSDRRVEALAVARPSHVDLVRGVDEEERRDDEEEAGDPEAVVEPGGDDREGRPGQVSGQGPLVVAPPHGERPAATS